MLPQVCDQGLPGLTRVSDGPALPPHGTRPRRITWVPRHDMDVKLRDGAAESANIDLGGASQRFERFGSPSYFLDQAHALGMAKIVDFRELDARWHKDKPRVPRHD